VNRTTSSGVEADSDELWFRDTQQGEDLRRCAWSFAQSLEKSTREEDRRNDFLKFASDYLGQPITSLYDFESMRASSNQGSARVNSGRIPRNLTRTLVDTALSRYAKVETRVLFATNGGTPEQQKRSEDCTDAANALIEQTEGEDCLRMAALHSCVFDLGIVKTIERDDGPVNEHIPSWELMFDPTDAHRGKPTIAVQRSTADKDALIAEFAAPADGEDRDARIDRQMFTDDIRSSSSEGLITADHTMSDQHCTVYELWRLPVGRFKGRHVIVTDHALLLDEEWDDKNFPFTLFGWSKPLFGAYPVSIANINSANQDELNGVAVRISQILRKMAIPLWLETGPASDKGVSVSQLRSGSDAIGDCITVGPGRQLTASSAGDKVGAELFQQEDRVWKRGFEMTGINEQSSQGTRPAGLNSAPAQREWNEINQDRLSLTALDYQRAHVTLARRLLVCISKIADYEITIANTNGRWMRRMKAADMKLDQSDYVIQPYPISALPLTPTGKLAAAADLLQMGAIDRDTFMEIVQIPDLKAKLDIAGASRKATEAIITKVLASGQYIAPLDMLEPGYASKYAVAKYLEGVASDMNEGNLALLKLWIDDLAARQKKAAKDAQAAAAAMAPPANTQGTSLAPIAPAPLAPPVSATDFGGQMTAAAA
jgi:hypothetical protein